MARLAAILIGLTAALSACADMHASATPVIALPDGYYLQPDKQEQTELVKRGGHRVIPGPIAAYGVSGHLVTGALGKEPPLEDHSYANDVPFEGGPNTRYFVLDTRTGKVYSDLDAAAWRRKLDELGAPKPLSIYPPLPWQQ
jgi:hypothetical protein